MNKPIIVHRNVAVQAPDMTLRMADLQTVNEDEHSVEAVVATDRMVTVFDKATYRIIDEILVADGGEFPKEMSLLDSHQQYTCGNVLGGATDFTRVGSQWRCRAVFDADDPEAAKIYRKVVKGFIKSVSIGYQVTRSVEIRPGESATVNGREYRARPNRVLRVAQRWRAFELSVTPIGADERAKFRDGVNVLTRREENNMNPRLLAYLRRLGLAQDATTEQAREYHAELTGSSRAIANALDYDQADHSARTSADLMIRALGFDPESPWNMLQQDGQAGRQQQQTAAGIDHSSRGTSTVTPPGQSTPAGGDGAALMQAQHVDQGDIQRAIEGERSRVATIRSLAGPDVRPELVERAVSEGWTVERTQGEFLREINERRGQGVPVSGGAGPAIHSRSRDRDVTRHALTSALLERSNLNIVEHGVENIHGTIVRSRLSQDERERAAEVGYRYRDMSLIDIARECCRIDGLNVGHGRSEVLAAVFGNERAMSSGTLAYIFTSNFSAQLLSGYDGYADTTRAFTSNGTLPDFKTTERTRMKKGDRLTKLARGKEADHVTRDDKSESYKLARYAAQFVADEQDFIDDTFGALESTTPMELGEAAAELRPDLVYSILLGNPNMADSVALFHTATHGNLTTSSALSAANLELAIAQFNRQTENGRILNKSGPIVLITPETLWATADRLINSDYRRDDNALGDRNTMRSQRIQHVSEARLDNGVTDPDSGTAHSGSTTDWYLSRAGRHTIEVGYLRGRNNRPQVRSFTLEQGRWGMGWDINLDIGAKALDWLGLRKHEQ